LDTCRKNPQVTFWAFTKSVSYWLKRIDYIPVNLILQASRGGKQDDLIQKYNLKKRELKKRC
jgi:hypothetical protein